MPSAGVGSKGADMGGFDDIQTASKDNRAGHEERGGHEQGHPGAGRRDGRLSEEELRDRRRGPAKRLLAAKSVEKAVEIQNEYLKSTYDGYISELPKLGSMMTDFAKDAYRPFESVFGKIPK